MSISSNIDGGSCSSTLAASQSTLWSWSQEWTAIPLFLFPPFTAFLCSVKCFHKFFPVSPKNTRISCREPHALLPSSSGLVWHSLLSSGLYIGFHVISTLPSPPTSCTFSGLTLRYAWYKGDRVPLVSLVSLPVGVSVRCGLIRSDSVSVSGVSC